MGRMSGEEHDIREFVCGWSAAVVNVYLTFPINKVIFRQMLYGVQTQTAVTQLKREGIHYLYRGIGPPLIQKSITVSIMFGTFCQYKKLLDTHCSSVLTHNSARKSLAAFMAGSTEAILTPFERVQMLLQDRKFHGQYNNTIHAFQELRRYGVREYYRGLSAVLCRNGPSNILFFTFRGSVKKHLPISVQKGKWWYELFEDFISGSCVGAIISTIFYPINVIRTRMQTRRVGSEFISMRVAFKWVYNDRDRSVRKLFYGVHVNYSRAFLSWGIINASYELFRKLLYGPELTQQFRRNKDYD